MKTQCFQVLLYFDEIERSFETEFQASTRAFTIFLK